jgi:hypothetical protein
VRAGVVRRLGQCDLKNRIILIIPAFLINLTTASNVDALRERLVSFETLLEQVMTIMP